MGQRHQLEVLVVQDQGGHLDQGQEAKEALLATRLASGYLDRGR